MKIICFSIVTIVGLCVAAIPFFKLDVDDDVEDAGFVSSLILTVVLFIVGFFGALLFS